MRRTSFYFYFILFFFTIPCLAHAQYAQLLHKTPVQRWDAVWKITSAIAFKNPDSAAVFRQMNGFRDFAEAHNDQQLALQADLMVACYLKNYRRDDHERVIASIKNVINKAMAIGDLATEARAHALLADYYFRGQSFYRFKPRGYYELAFNEYFTLEKLLRKIPDDAYPDKMLNLNDIGAAYYFFSDYRKAVNYLREAIKIKYIPWNGFGLRSVRNTLGLCYMYLGKLDSSDYYYRLALNKKDPTYNQVAENIAKGNLGYNCYLRGEYEQAIPLLQADINSAVKLQDWGLAAGSLIPLADIYLKQNRYPQAEKLIQEAKNDVIKSKQYKRYAVLYPLLSKLYTIKGQPKLASVYLDSVLFVKDSLARKFNVLQLLRAEEKADAQQQRAEIDKLNAEKSYKELERNVLLAFVLILTSLALYITRNQRKKHRQNELLFKLELENKEKELTAAAVQLNEFTKSISEKNRLIETFEDQFGENSSNAALEQLRQSTIITDEGWEQFRRLFGQVHGDYLHRLSQKVPGLTPAETRLMALAKLHLSNKEMAAVLGVSTQNTRTIWYRMRKKLGLPEEDTIKNLADTV